MWSPSPCLNKLATSHETQKCCSVRFLCPKEELAKSPLKWFGMRLATGHKMKTETQIEEPLTLLDSWHMISARAPLTLGSHASEVSLFIDFEN
jgi:hypothetical protein